MKRSWSPSDDLICRRHKGHMTLQERRDAATNTLQLAAADPGGASTQPRPQALSPAHKHSAPPTRTRTRPQALGPAHKHSALPVNTQLRPHTHTCSLTSDLSLLPRPLPLSSSSSCMCVRSSFTFSGSAFGNFSQPESCDWLIRWMSSSR